MKIDGTNYRSVWLDADDGWSVHILDQPKLPWSLDVLRLTTRDEAAHAILAHFEKEIAHGLVSASYVPSRYAPPPGASPTQMPLRSST